MGRTDWRRNSDGIRKCGGRFCEIRKVKGWEMKRVIKEGACD